MSRGESIACTARFDFWTGSRLLIGLALAMSGGACQTPNPFEATYTEAEPGLFYITMEGSKFADDDDLKAAWHRRARSLCPDGYESLLTRSYTTAAQSPVPDSENTQSNNEYKGYARCK